MSAVDGGQPELEISDDPLDGVRLDVSRAPVLVTLCKIGNHCVVDPTLEEEACSTASLVMSVTPDGKVTTVRKTGSGSFHIETLSEAVNLGQEIAVDVQKALTAKILQEERMGIGRKKIGFMDP